MISTVLKLCLQCGHRRLSGEDRGDPLPAPDKGDVIIPSQLLTKCFGQVLFSADGQHLFTAGDKHIRIFHNVPGIEINIQELKEVLKRNMSNSAAKERIEKQIKLAEENLKNILAS